MTGRKSKRVNWGGRTATVAFSLCLLAVVTMIGMYTVGRTDQKQRELEQQVAEAQERKSLEEARQQQIVEEKQQAASAAARRALEKTEDKKQVEAQREKEAAELESEFAEGSISEAPLPAQEKPQAAPLSFSADKDKLLWPIAGDIILDYSMDKTIYFATLDQYKYNPAVIIQGSPDESVLCGAEGKVSSVKTLEETGTTVTVDIGSGYELVYGQLKELLVKEGDSLKEGGTIGHVSEPTKYYTKEGSNVYFEIRKDGESIDPMTLLQ